MAERNYLSFLLVGRLVLSLNPVGPHCIDLMYSFMSIHQIKGTPLEKLGTGLNFCARQIRSSLKQLISLENIHSVIFKPAPPSTLPYKPLRFLLILFTFDCIHHFS